MKIFTKFLAVAIAASAFAFVGTASAEEAPDVLVKRISTDVLETARSDKDIQSGNNNRIMELVEQKILPYVNFEHMTRLAAGRFWRQATPDQQMQLITEFRSLLVYTYAGALSQVRDQKIEFKPLRAAAGDTDVEVNSQVISSRGGEPIQISYRLEKTASGWKLYDVNVLGAWLVEAYKGTFNSEISRGGIDGLIKALSDKNKQLAARANKK